MTIRIFVFIKDTSENADWNKHKKITKHIHTKSKKQIEFANRLKFPTESFTKDKSGEPERMLTVQLPLYGACLKAHDSERFKGPITGYDYLVLAEDQAKVVSVKKYVDLSLRTARVAIERINANIFWPARVDEDEKLYDLGRIFSSSPEKDLAGSDWLKKQEAKLKELENA